MTKLALRRFHATRVTTRGAWKVADTGFILYRPRLAGQETVLNFPEVKLSRRWAIGFLQTTLAADKEKQAFLDKWSLWLCDFPSRREALAQLEKVLSFESNSG